jgi:hypothetical protein
VIHVVIYGWPLGFPLPSQAARYFPFFGAIALVTYGIVTAALVLSGVARFSDPSPPEAQRRRTR